MSQPFRVMPPHQRKVQDFLRGVGATNVHMQHGGKHHKICFTYANQERSYPLACTPKNADHAAHNSIKALTRILDLPRSKSRAEKEIVMTNTTVNGTTEPFNPMPIGEIRPPRILAARPNNDGAPAVTCNGKVACYRGNGPTMTFRITAEMWRAFRALQPDDSHVEVFYMGDNSWKIVPSRQGRARFYKDNASYTLQLTQQATFDKLGHFYATPAEYMLVDGTMLATLKEAPRATPNAPSVVTATVARAEARRVVPNAVAQEASTPPKNVQDTLLNVATTTSNTQLRMEALLVAIRNVEKETVYRLKKDKETNDWCFAAPIVR